MIDERTLFGILALVFGFLSFQMRRRKNILMCQFATRGVFCLHYLLNIQNFGFAISAVSAVRNLLLANVKRKLFIYKIIPYFFSVVVIGVAYIFWQGVYSLLFIAGHIINCFGLSFKEPDNICKSFLISSPVLIVYELLTKSYGGALFEIVILVSVIIRLLTSGKEKRHRAKSRSWQ